MLLLAGEIRPFSISRAFIFLKSSADTLMREFRAREPYDQELPCVPLHCPYAPSVLNATAAPGERSRPSKRLSQGLSAPLVGTTFNGKITCNSRYRKEESQPQQGQPLLTREGGTGWRAGSSLRPSWGRPHGQKCPWPRGWAPGGLARERCIKKDAAILLLS